MLVHLLEENLVTKFTVIKMQQTIQVYLKQNFDPGSHATLDLHISYNSLIYNAPDSENKLFTCAPCMNCVLTDRSSHIVHCSRTASLHSSRPQEPFILHQSGLRFANGFACSVFILEKRKV